ncbi:TIP4-2 [Symbiodinium necroappetens]|uniref:TIP4-2 protein n=1 Tax=Symbiodinium necroappetens TaxID=1628268 RepID=A0A812S2C7_9DINO|nr:TIP4-2 [Symbiodinium necroappetens]
MDSFRLAQLFIKGHSSKLRLHIEAARTVLTYALAGVSGANFSPAVTLALYLSKRLGGPGLDASVAGMYALVQLVGGICCGFCFVNMFADSFRLGPGAGFSWVDACFCEAMYSCLFCFVVLNTTAARAYSSEGNEFYGMAIGAMALAASYAAGPVSGGLLNPAITVGVDFAGAGAGFGKSLVYAIFQLLGAGIAAFLFKMVRPMDFDEPESPRTRLISEIIGTFALVVVTVGLSALAKTSMAVVAIAGPESAFRSFWAAWRSGAHFNPAVTVAVLLSGHDADMTPKRAVHYIGSQLLSCVLAGWCFCLLYNGSSFVLGPGQGFSLTAAAVAEMFFTALLAFVVLGVAVSPKTKSSQLFGLAIGLCIVVGGSSAGNISGACLNPAVSIGIAASTAGWAATKTALRYCFFQLLGGSIAGGVVHLLHSEIITVNGHGETSKLIFGHA